MLPFLLGVGTFMNVHVIGYVTLTELFVLGWFACLLVTGQLKFRSRTMGWLLAFAGIWVLSVIATDLYRDAYLEQFARGFGRTVVIFCALWTGYLYFQKYPRTLKPLFVGFTVSAIVNIFGFRAASEEFVLIHGYELESSWERNYTYVTLMLCFSVAAYLYQRAPWATLGFAALTGCLNIAMGSRNLGGTIVAASLLTGLARHFFRPVEARSQGSVSTVLILSVLITVVGSSVYAGYKFAAGSGLLGDKSYQKYESQAGSPMGLLFASRADFIGGLFAIKDSPIIGYGSWPFDTEGYLVEAFRAVGVNENDLKELQGMVGRIPTHSMMLEAWVEHGFLAMIFWLIVIVVVFRALAAGALQDREWGLVNGLVIIWMIWNLLFSPLGNRPFTAVMILILVLVSERRLTPAPNRVRRIRLRASSAHLDERIPALETFPLPEPTP